MSHSIGLPVQRHHSLLEVLLLLLWVCKLGCILSYLIIFICFLAIGIILGAFFMTRFRPKGRTVLIIVFLVEMVTPLALLSGFFLGCHPLNIGGQISESQGYFCVPEVCFLINKKNCLNRFSLDTTCNSGCECSTSVYTPICAPDGKMTYFSPCHAGCKNYNGLNSVIWFKNGKVDGGWSLCLPKQTFENCNCFSGPASKGYCESDVKSCTGLGPYMGTIIVSNAKCLCQLILIKE